MGRKRKERLARGDGDVLERQRVDGTIVYQARWYETDAVSGKPVRRSQTFEVKDEAEKHLRETATRKLDGSYIPPSDRTIADLINEWIARGTARWKPVTVSTYRRRADAHVIPAFGGERASRLTTPRIQHWIDRLTIQGYDASMIDSVVRILSASLREAVQIGALVRNPADGVRRPPVRVKEAPTWTLKEVAAVMRVVGAQPLWHAIYRLALSTGMRPGELRALRWSDVDLAAQLITIRRTMSKDVDGHVSIGDSTKTGRSRQIAVAPSSMKVLNVWRVAQKANRVASRAWHDEDLVFDRGDGRFLPLTTWQRHHEAIIEQAGAKRVTLHQLRHTHATLELEAGTHPLIVSRRLGHASIQTTLDRYSHVSMDLQRAAAESLDTRLFGDDPDATSGATSPRKSS